MNRSVFDDPITLEVVWGRLVTLADEMQTVLRRTAFSTVVSTGNDLGCEIMDARAWSVAHAVTSNPTFNLTLPHLTAALLETFPAETLREGDVLFTNDPWIGAGHLPDVAVVTPFFKRGRVVGFAGSIAHVSDIGGLLNQSEARSVYEEGVYFPPLKLYDAGVRNEAVFSTLRGSVRTPELVIGDINAIVTANSVAAAHTVDLLDEYGLDDLQQLSDAVQSRAEKAMRATIESIPDGTYPFELTFDELDGELTLGVELAVSGSDLLVDYVRVPPQHPHGGINSTLTFTTARTTYALNCLLTPQIPSNQGLFRPVRVQAPSGSVLNPVHPASVNDRTKVGWHVIPLVQGGARGRAARADPGGGRVQEQPAAHRHRCARRRRQLARLHRRRLGRGPRRRRGRRDLLPDELVEHPGRDLRNHHRGADRAEGTGTGDGRRGPVPGRARAGGHAAAAAGGQRAHPRGRVSPAEPPAVRPRGRPRGPAAGAPTVTLRTAGGGGHGSPVDRPVEAVLRDVRDELLSVEEALDVYGVTVDLEALTATRRTSPCGSEIP